MLLNLKLHLNKQQMLLRPPLIHEEDVKSQSSNHKSSIQKQKSNRSTSKNRKKQSTIGLANKNIQRYQQNRKNNQYEQKQFDNQSVHSVNSKKSKGKTKQSTIALKKRCQNSHFLLQNKYTQNQIIKLDSEDDNKSVNSHTSKNSKKNKVKQNSLGKNKLQIKINYYQQDKNKYKPIENHFLNNQTINYSKVQKVQLNQNQTQNSPKVVKYENKNPFKDQYENKKPFKDQYESKNPFKYQYENKNSFKGQKLSHKNERGMQKKQQAIQNKQQVIQNKQKVIQNKQQAIQNKQRSYRPFQDITLNRQDEQQGPVFILKQEEFKLKNNNNGSSFKAKANHIDKHQLVNQQILFQNQQKGQLIQIQQQKNCQNQTKSISKTRRNKIFQNGNNSKSNIDSSELNISSNFQKSRSKSKSKLGGLLKQNRQKKFNQSKVQNFSNVSNYTEIGKKQLVKNSNIEQPKQFHKNQINGKIIQMYPVQRKQETHIQKFDLGLSQSELNLSNSIKKQHFEFQQKQKDSVHFNFQRQREHHKKGLSITSKQKKNNYYQQIHGSLQSKKQSHIERLKKKQQQSQDILNSILLKPELNQSSKYQQYKQLQTIQAKSRNGIQLIKPQKNQIKMAQCQNNITSQKLANIRPNTIKLKNNQEYKIPIDCELFTRDFPQQQKYSIKQVKRQQFIVSKSQTSPLNQNKLTNEVNYNKKNEKVSQNFCYRQNKNQISQKDEKIVNKPLRQQKQVQIVLERLPSIQTQQISETRSQKSNSQQKRLQKKVKQNSLNKGKKHNVQVRNQSPRGEQSFYESDKQDKKHQIIKQFQNKNNKCIQNNVQTTKTKQQQFKQKVQNKKPAKLINFDSQEQIQNFKSKTDSNFYQYCQQSQKSLKPPSSKPPLSKRSNASSSKSKSKSKQSTIKINKQNSLRLNKGQQQIKKKSLVELALQKNYEGSNYSRSNSQQSFNSRQSGGDYSTDSKKSKSSKKSFKKESTLPISIKSKNSTFTSGLAKPPIKKIYTDNNSQIQIFDPKNSYISDKLSTVRQQKEERQKNNQIQNINQRKIISKDTYFIDQNGKLVKKDLVIQGNKAYGMSNSQQQAEQLIKSRMKRSRQRHNSRSKSRQKSQSRLNKKSNSSTFYDQQVYQSNYSNSTSKQNKRNQFYSNSYYQNFTTQNQYQYGKKYNLPPKTLQQFLKPLEQKPLYKFQKNTNKKIQSQFYQNQQKFEYQQSYVQKTTLNQLFGKNEDFSKQSGRKKSLHRTEKHTNRKG